MRMVKVRILPPQPIHLKPQDLFSRFLTKYSFLTIDLVHEPSRAILYGTTAWDVSKHLKRIRCGNEFHSFS